MRIRLLASTLALFLSFTVDAQTTQIVCSGWTDQQWFIGSQYGSRKIRDCAPNANFLCHGFATAYVENGCTQLSTVSVYKAGPYATGPDDNYLCANIQSGTLDGWRTSGKYVQVCNLQDAILVYYNVEYGGHTAVRDVSNATVKYISKYGKDGPLVVHDLTGTYYNYANMNGANDLSYYAYIGSIVGNRSLIGTSAATFSVAPVPGVTYSWSISYTPRQYAYISGATNQPTVTVQPTHSGPVSLKLTAQSACGVVTQQIIQLSIDTRVCLEGSYTTSSLNTVNLSAANAVPTGPISVSVTCPNANSYTWTRTSGSIGLGANGSQASFTMTSGGSISMTVTAKQNGTMLSSRNLSFYNYGSFAVYPNPTYESIQVDLNPDLDFDMRIESFSNPSKSPAYFRNDAKGHLDLGALDPGEYVLFIALEGKPIHQSRFTRK